jgi:hypothetical protein
MVVVVSGFGHCVIVITISVVVIVCLALIFLSTP